MMYDIETDLEEGVRCPLCGGEGDAAGGYYDFPPFRVVPCSGCGLWFLSPRLREEAMRRVYAAGDYFEGGGSDGYSHSSGSYEDQEVALRRTFRHLLSNLARRGIAGGRLLEVGAGYGYLLDEAQRHFTSRTGTDYDPRAVTRMRDLGIEAFEGGAEALPVGARFNLIVTTGVIEHVYQPQQFVQRLRGHLEEEGWMVAAAPMMDSFWLRLMGHRWPSFKIPEHIAYYNRRTLGELFRRCGAREVVDIPYPATYPLGLVAAKLGLPLPHAIRRLGLWLPSTMVAAAARFR